MAKLETEVRPTKSRTSVKGLLITTDPSLARAFRRELSNCTDCAISFELHANFDEACRAGGGPYQCVTVDLDGAVVPNAAVPLARSAWPLARIAVLSFWWSDQSNAALDQADVVIHKPLRAAELRAFLRSPTGSPKAGEAVTALEPRAVSASR
jgi:hypothetical protein